MSFSETINDLFEVQLNEWELAGMNYNLLKKVMIRSLNFSGFEIQVQYNPERMRSSAAKVDAKSIEARPCFLCPDNMPVQQRGITFDNDMTVLVNPFPIFNRHLTIPSENHIDQRILPNFGKMLGLADSLPDYLVFYNGPQCGASAPDHFHFQAGNRGFLPIEKDFIAGKFTRSLSVKNGVEILNWSGYLRGVVTLRGSVRENMISVFNDFYRKFASFQPDKPEPMLNILAYKETNDFIVHIIPRILHRPRQFFEKGSQQILLSPASVDLAGVIIVPREEDFIKITKSDIEDIYNQVCLGEDKIEGFFN
jgi:ATP adenylyltransferase/5',5'''-P-1,P-4-tetraphosphate phosphorylase II